MANNRFLNFVFLEVRCPALPTVSIGTYTPADCDDGTKRFFSTCTLACPDGYHIAYGPETLISDTRKCQLDGTWEYRATSPTCKGQGNLPLFVPPPRQKFCVN